MLRFAARALAACASVAAITLPSPAASSELPLFVVVEENFSEPASIADRWQVTAGSWSAARGTYGSTALQLAPTTVG